MSDWALVAGGAGFLGSHLCKALLSKNRKVICLDNLYTGSIQNIQELMQNSNFLFLEMDIIELDKINKDISEIFNLACPASPKHYQRDPLFTIKTSFIGTLNLLELAKSKSAKLLQASTSEIYGDPSVHPQHEEYWGNVNPIGIRSCYDEGKRAAETLCFDYIRKYNLDIRVCRIFNTYGPNMHPDDGRVVSNFIVQALQNKPITVYGDGSQTRSFCYVDDLIRGFLALINSEHRPTEPYNLGNPDEFTIMELAQHVINLTNSTSKIEFRSLPQDDPIMRRPDISKAIANLDWSPHYDLKAGLISTIEYFKQASNED